MIALLVLNFGVWTLRPLALIFDASRQLCKRHVRQGAALIQQTRPRSGFNKLDERGIDGLKRIAGLGSLLGRSRTRACIARLRAVSWAPFRVAWQ